jgi:ATP-dependent Lhr-like helicase
MAAVAPTETLTHPTLAWAHPVVQEWFLTKFGSPTEPQIAGWPAIFRGDPTLISAPTGSGKTLAAFLACIDRLFRASIAGTLAPCTHVLYISPLKALSNDVQKNLDAPLAEIQQLALQRGYLGTEIRTGVRTGDTLAKHRASQLKHPPHILVTTPESLYILLTAGKSRQNLTRVHTVIVDEIHALAPNKRGAHLALSLERLDALVCGENPLAPGTFTTGRSGEDMGAPHLDSEMWVRRTSGAPQRIGLSATQNPIELVANFLTGTPRTSHLAPGPSQATIIQIGNRRTLDLAIEVPSAELGSLTTTAMWQEIFDKLATLAQQHRSTLVFVNTRRLVEKISFELSERLAPTLGADAVAAHHGSLSRLMRLDAEQRLKSGECRILIATASLELGIDIGNIDLVCQIATTRSISTAMQRVGRAGHWRGATPKGRFFATTRDDLLEQAALLRNMTAGELDQLTVPEEPVDVLMQQIVAAVGAESWDETALFHVLRRAYPYRNLSQAHFAELLALLHNGIESSRGRYGAYLLRDQVHGHLHARRGARSIAISNGGAIPDTSIFAVMLQPENVQIATLDEHFAVDSSPGDVVLLGNTSWRIQRVDPQGKVLVEDAHGAPPSIPFWEGEAPQRTGVLSTAVSNLRAELDHRTSNISPRDLLSLNLAGAPHLASEMWDGSATASSDSPQAQLHNTLHFLQTHCFLNPSAALQLITYIVHGRAALGAVPTKTTIIAERFFDEGGGQQLILHAPFGGRINKAWGLALRKRFCRGFNFELQAAATDNGINISLAEQHSFPLADVFHFLTTLTARELLEQACIPSPLFKNRWRWAAGRSLQLLRMSKGKRIAPQIQRTRSDDLLASVFPHASACPETMTGDIVIPQHPLVDEVMKDTLTEAMDIEGLLEVLQQIAAGSIRCLAIDTPVPSVFAHELVHAMPYAFLDDEDAAARRTRAVALRRGLPDAVTEGAGILDPAAIATVRQQLAPDIRDEHELHDLLLQLTVLPVALLSPQPLKTGPLTSSTSGKLTNWQTGELEDRLTHSGPSPRQAASGGAGPSTRHWPHLFTRLAAQGRAHQITLHHQPFWIATERLAAAALLWPEAFRSELPSSQLCAEQDPEPPPPPTNSLLANSPLATQQDPGPPQPYTSPRDAATTSLTQGWLQILGPTTAAHLAALVHLHPRSIHQSLLAMELQGLALRGVFEGPHATPLEGARLQPCQSPHTDVAASAAEVDAQTPPNPDYAIEWCERRILHRIHRLTLGTLRKSVEPVSAAVFMRWLLDWHHLAPNTQHTGEEAVLAAIEQLEGFEAPAIEWERSLLPARIANYNPQWLDNLCLAGVLAWARVSPHPVFTSGEGTAPRRVIPTSAAPITFYLRESADWLHHALAAKSIDPTVLQHSLSPEAQTLRALLAQQGAAFTTDLQRLSGLTKLQTTTALWELATAGLASADGFDQLRSLLDPRRKSVSNEQKPATSLRKRAAARTTAGRWFLLCVPYPIENLSSPPITPNPTHLSSRPKRSEVERPLYFASRAETLGAPGLASETWVSSVQSQGQPKPAGAPEHANPTASAIAAAKYQAAALESHARILLTRYGVLFREFLTRESNAPAWRDLVPVLRRLEARGEVRGGRFVAGPFGEQFALPEAADALRKARSQHTTRANEGPIPVAAADPLNLAGILVPGDRTPAIPGRTVHFQNGAVLHDETAPAPPPPAPKPRRSMADLLRAESLPPRPTTQPQPQGLFS